MNRVHYNINTIVNSEDKTKLKNALNKLDGISFTAIDVARGTVEVGFKEPANESQIRDCISNTGYTIS